MYALVKTIDMGQLTNRGSLDNYLAMSLQRQVGKLAIPKRQKPPLEGQQQLEQPFLHPKVVSPHWLHDHITASALLLSSGGLPASTNGFIQKMNLKC